MTNDELFYYLALQSVEGIGPVNARKLLNHFGSAELIFKEKQINDITFKGSGKKLNDRLRNPRIFEKAKKEILFLERHKLKAIGFKDEDYPERLKNCADAPILLFKKGNFDVNRRKVISVVGTRLMTNYGANFLKEFIAGIRQYDPVVVSGLAYGIDIYAHKECLKNEISTIGVLGHGLDRVYPKIHTRITDQMLEKGGLLTEFTSGTVPEKMNFVKRNRIIAGVSEATIVVESANKGGSLITAQLASSYHRDVFAVPGKTTDRFSRGCNMLIKSNKAAMITDAKDLEYVLGWEPKTLRKTVVQKKLFIELEENEKQVLNQLISSDKKLLDQLVKETGYSVHKTIGLLLQLELKGLVKSFPGKKYKAI